jgi:DNA-binding SARP family transcriptional activator
LGQLREALDSITQSERLTQSMGRAGYEALARVKLTRATILDGLGDTPASLRAGSEALALAEEIHDDGLLAEALVDMAELLLFDGKLDGLADMVQHGLALADATGNQAVRITGLSVLALVLMVQGYTEEAIQSGNGAVSLARQITVSTERGAVLFGALIGQAQVFCACAVRETAPEKRTLYLRQALGLAREATTIAEASQSARLRLHAFARLGAVQMAQGDIDLALGALGYAELSRGQFNDNATGQIYFWQLMAAWERPQPDFRQVESLLRQVKELATFRNQTYFVQAEGEKSWQTYQSLIAALDQNALSESRYAPAPVEIAAESVSGATGPTSQITLVQHDLRVCGFGLGRVWRGEELVTTGQWGWSRPREIFFYILTVRKATRAQIGVLFWPEAESSSMTSSFHNAKFAIKNALDKPVIAFDNGLYVINPKVDILYDVSCFEQLLNTASHSPPAEALTNLLDAANLYQDEFLIDFDSEWVDKTRRLLSAKFTNCCLDAGKAALTINQPDAVLSLLERAFQLDEINEEFARMLMTTQWKSGKRHAALETYARLKAALQRELGARPSLETEQLYTAIKGS